MKRKQIEYGLAGLGSALLGYYIILKLMSNMSAQTNTKNNQSISPQTNMQNIQSTSPQPSVSTQCQEITPNTFSQQLLANCFGGSLTACGLYEPLTSVNGFCEAFSPSTNYSVNMPNIKSGLVFNNQTDGFFGLYWAYPGVFGGVSPCYCNGTNAEFPANNTGAIFQFLRVNNA